MKSITLIMLVLCCFASSGVFAATMIDGKPNNPYGVMLGLGGGDSSDYCSLHFQWARDLVGEWGHVRVGSGVRSEDVNSTIRTLAICRAKHLIPVMTTLYVPDEYRIPGGEDSAAYVREDGYPLAAEKYRAWAKALAKQGAVVPYYELGNEINGKWKPEAYGKFIIAVSKALKSEMPKLHMTSAGLAGNGADFLTDVLKAVPDAKNYIDCYGLHPYGANHPPAYTQDGYCLRGHFWTADALTKFGVTQPQFVMTESGYELDNRADNRFARITDELRAKYLVEAYRDFWAPDPRVVTLTLFMLQATNYPGWNGWVLVDTDCKKTKTYEALAAVPKPKGSDWMPQGKCSISGKITDQDSKQGLDRVFLYTVPGIYAAETDSKGNYKIANLPAGSYQINAFRDGFNSLVTSKMKVTERQPGNFSASIKRFGFIADGFDYGDKYAGGWLPTNPDALDKMAVDAQVKRSGVASQRITAKPGDDPGLWQCTAYASAVPDRHFAAEVWVKGKGVKLGGGKGAVLTLSVTDSNAQDFSSASVNLPLEGDFDWTPITVTIPPYAPGRRLVMKCTFEAQEGTVWFDDPYCHYANYPVSSALKMKKDTSEITGSVIAEKDERMADAVVWLSPGNFWAATRSDGTYTLSNIPAGTYDVWSFRRDKMCVAKRGVKVGKAEKIKLDLQLRKAPASREVINPGFEHRGPNNDFTFGWTRFGEFDGIPLNGWHKGIPDHPQGIMSHTGNSFAGSVAGTNVKNGGLYQIIAADPDKTYDVSVWSYTYQTDDGRRGDISNRLGIDPTGGTDPNGAYVIWTPCTPSYLAWSRLSLKVAPVEDRMTIFLQAKQIYGLTYNVNCFDDVSVAEDKNGLPAPQMVAPVINKK